MANHSNFVHLHAHTQYSLLDGACLITDLIDLAKAFRMPAVSITDHGNMFGAIEFYYQAMKAGIKPIIGCETYLAPNSRFEKSAHGIKEAAFHILLLAKDETGYRNLMKIVTAGYLEGFYYRPRVDKDFLAEHSKGLIALTACLKGEVPHLVMTDRMEQAKQVCGQYQDIFGKGNFYLEIMNNKIPEQEKVTKRLIELSKEVNIPLVATNDIHYLTRDNAKAHEALLCIQTQTTLDDPNRMKLQTEEFYMKSPEEMTEAFSEVPQAISNTVEIAEKCNLEIDFTKTYLPQYKAPEGKTGESYLRELCNEGLTKKYGKITPEIEKRFDHEISVINKSGYMSYFLIAWDFVSHAKRENIPVGPGRGSAAGSIVSYALGITDIDPLKYDLLFERFLNPDRVSLPDIDIDFCYERRQEVIDYVTAKYSKENVSQIITFGTMMAKGVIRDVGRVMAMPYADVDKIAKLIPNELGMKIKNALEIEPELKEMYKKDPQITELLDTSMALEGLTRHASTHAAGVVISEDKLMNHIPLYKQGEQITTGYPMVSLERIGLLKMDFLGLRNLTVIDETLKIVKRMRNIDLQIDKITLDDEKTFDLLRKAESIGVFQLESSGMRDLLRKLRPGKFEDLIAVLALFRPGPIGSGMVDDFISRKNGGGEIKYDHPSLEPILKDTYGIIVYQEQIMRICSNLAGFSLAKADSLRRAISKKNPEIMLAAKNDFINGCVKRGVEEKVADRIFNYIEYFAGYGFNKCVIGSTELLDLDSGEFVSVESLYNSGSLIRTASCDEESYKIVPQRIKDIVCNGIKMTYCLKTASGKEIVATGNHPFFTASGWKELKDLKSGDRIATPRLVPRWKSEKADEYKIISLACLLAEGNLCHTSGLYFYSNSRQEAEEFSRNIECFPRTKARIYERGGKLEVYAGTGRDTRFVKGRVPWNKAATSPVAVSQDARVRSGARLWIEELGLNNKKSVEKFVPAFVYSLGPEQLALFIGKLWTGDGYVFGKRNTPFYATSSRRMADDLQRLLLRLGIISVIRDKVFKYNYKGETKLKYGRAISLIGEESRRNFLEKICPHITGKKEQIALLRGCFSLLSRDRDSKDTIPAQVRLVVRSEKERTGKTWDEIERESGVCVKELYGTIKRHKKGFRRSTIRRLAEYFNSSVLYKFASSDIYWDTIHSIVPAGKQKTYDVEMEKIHNFIANGIIVHNSHSAAYAMISYRTAYLKANFPVEYMTALLTSEKDNTDKLVVYIDELNRMGIKIFPPAVNESYSKFTIVPEGVRFGLAAIKNVGHGAIDSVIEARKKNGPFESLYAFCEQIDSRLVNRKVLESLIKCGAFDSFKLHRSQLMAILDQAMEVAGGIQKDRMKGQLSFFDTFEDQKGFKETFQDIPNIPEWPENQLLAYEKQLLGFYVTKHPLTRYEKLLKTYSTCGTTELAGLRDGDEAFVGGIINKVKFTVTKRTGEKMAIVKLEDLKGMVEVLVFPSTFQKIGGLIKDDAIIFVKGRISLREQDPKIMADDIIPLDEVKKRYTKSVAINVMSAGLEKNTLNTIKGILANHRGPIPVYVTITTPSDRKVDIQASDDLRVQPTDEMIKDIEDLLGEGAVSLRAL
ncbi:MAG: DNA polymerase III subunit alpha [Candidatus Omnitrophota bacterium]